MMKNILLSLPFALLLFSAAYTPSERPATGDHGVTSRQSLVDTFLLRLPDLVAERDSQVCLTVSALEFKRMLSMQYSMSWDTSVLKFRQVRAFGLPSMGPNNFGTHLAAKGTLTFSWYDPNLRGMTKGGPVALYELCFLATGLPGSKTQISFGSHPTVVEIANAAAEFYVLASQGGKVEVRK
ncbi:MAG: hypothetical protein RI973_948 [Bacteroidota bacterium]|jgi:hypothetical protein